MTSVIATRATGSATDSGTPSPCSHAETDGEMVAPPNAEEKNPATVTPTWTAERKVLGSRTSSAIFAPRGPERSMSSTCEGRSDTIAISVAAKTPPMITKSRTRATLVSRAASMESGYAAWSRREIAARTTQVTREGYSSSPDPAKSCCGGPSAAGTVETSGRIRRPRTRKGGDRDDPGVLPADDRRRASPFTRCSDSRGDAASHRRRRTDHGPCSRDRPPGRQRLTSSGDAPRAHALQHVPPLVARCRLLVGVPTLITATT